MVKDHEKTKESANEMSDPQKLKKKIHNQAHERKQLHARELMMILESACAADPKQEDPKALREQVDLGKVFEKAELDDDTIVNWDHFLQNYSHLLKKYKNPPLFSLLAASIGKAKRMFKMGDRVEARPIRWNEDKWYKGEIKRCQAQDALVEFDNYKYDQLWIPTDPERLRYPDDGTGEEPEKVAEVKSRAFDASSPDLTNFFGIGVVVLFLYYMGTVLFPGSGGGTKGENLGLVTAAVLFLVVIFVIYRYNEQKQQNGAAERMKGTRLDGDEQGKRQDTFDELDANGDGVISREEWDTRADLKTVWQKGDGDEKESESTDSRESLRKEARDERAKKRVKKHRKRQSPFRQLQQIFRQVAEANDVDFSEFMKILIEIGAEELTNARDIFNKLCDRNTKRVNNKVFWKAFRKNIPSDAKDSGRDANSILREAILDTWQSPMGKLFGKLVKRSPERADIDVQSLRRILQSAVAELGPPESLASHSRHAFNLQQVFRDLNPKDIVNWEAFLGAFSRKDREEQMLQQINEALRNCIREGLDSAAHAPRARRSKSKGRRKGNNDVTKLWRMRVNANKFGRNVAPKQPTKDKRQLNDGRSRRNRSRNKSRSRRNLE